jgi:DNA-binding transcriptional ArsR family regulator
VSPLVNVRDVMPGSAVASVRIEAAGAYELLIELSVVADRHGPRAADPDPERARWLDAVLDRASPAFLDAVERVGDRSGEVWLHLLGLAMETPRPRDAAGLLALVEATDPVELRRHLLGAYVPAWRKYVEPAVILAAAEGDRAAQARLETDGRYYAGRAGDALPILLGQNGRQTRRAVLDVLRRWYDESFAARERAVLASLDADASAARELASLVAPARLIEVVTAGFVYEPDPDCPSVLLIPHLAARPWLLLCQHRDTRLICYPARRHGREAREELADGLVRLGRALADEQRVRILTSLAGGARDLDELAAALGLARSTVHHHLGLLRAAKLISLQGNARRYRYGLRREAVGEANSLLAGLMSLPSNPAARSR